MDTDVIEIRTLRERKIEATLLKCYVEEILLNIDALVLETKRCLNCNGCIALDRHVCPRMSDRDKVWFYFDHALARASEENIAKTFVNSLKDMKPSVNGHELLRHIYQDTKTELRRLYPCDFIELRDYLKNQYESIMNMDEL